MGSACCVAARDRTIINGPSSDVMPRNARYSPSWSFRWDNRGRVAGEEMSVNWLSDGAGMNGRLDNKSQTTVETAYASEDGSPLENSQNLAWQKSSSSEGNTVCRSGIRVNDILPSKMRKNNKFRDPLNSKAPTEVKGSRGTPVTSEPSPTKLSPSTLSVSSFATSPLSSSQGLPPSRWLHHSPGHHLQRQVSDNRVPGMKSPNFSISEEGSPFMPPGWRNNFNMGSNGGSSDGFSEFMATSNRERWSFDSESPGFSRDKISRSSGRVSSSPSADMHPCGVCRKITDVYAVVAVLTCGHIYHEDCLEKMTPETYKYDPACPVCTYGEKKVLKLYEKTLKAETDLNAKFTKKLFRCRVDGNVKGDSLMFDRRKSSREPRMGPSSSVGRPFLRKHFSFGSKGSRSLSENNSSRKKGFFWAKSSRE